MANSTKPLIIEPVLGRVRIRTKTHAEALWPHGATMGGIEENDRGPINETAEKATEAAATVTVADSPPGNSLARVWEAGPLFCPHHGLIPPEKALEARGHRLRCPVDGCGRFIGKAKEGEKQSAARAQGEGLGRPRQQSESIPLAIAHDPEILNLVKEKHLVRLRREIEEMQAPLDTEQSLGKVKERLGTMGERIDSLEATLSDLQARLKGSLLIGIRRRFECECGSSGCVEVPLMCTNCGKGTRWGWRPQEE